MATYNEMNGDGPKDLSHVIPHMTVLQFQGKYMAKETSKGGPVFEAMLKAYDGRLVIWRSFIFVPKLEDYCR
jgi:hypothetical protein